MIAIGNIVTEHLSVPDVDFTKGDVQLMPTFRVFHPLMAGTGMTFIGPPTFGWSRCNCGVTF